MRKILFILFLAPFWAQSQTIPVSIGYSDTAHFVRISNDQTTFPSPQRGTLLHLVSSGVIVNPRISMDSYNGANILGSVFQGRRAGGSAATPASVTTDYTITGLVGDGYGTDSFHNVSTGAYLIKAEGTFTNTSAPTYLSLMTTPSGSTTVTERMRISSSGAVKFNALGEGILQSSSSGDLSVLTGTASQVLRRNAANNAFEFATLTATVDTVHNSDGALATYANTQKIIKDSVFNLLSPDYTLKAYRALGSVIRAQTVGFSRENITTTQNLATGTARYIAVYVPQQFTMTGFKWYQGTAGNFVGNNYNGLAIYSYSSGTLTLIDSTTRAEAVWKGSSNTWQSKALNNTQVLVPGIYFICMIYSSSSQTTAPAVGGTPAFGNAASVTMDFTNSSRIAGTKTSTTIPPSSIAMSTISNVANTVYVALY